MINNNIPDITISPAEAWGRLGGVGVCLAWYADGGKIGYHSERVSSLATRSPLSTSMRTALVYAIAHASVRAARWARREELTEEVATLMSRIAALSGISENVPLELSEREAGAVPVVYYQEMKDHGFPRPDRGKSP